MGTDRLIEVPLVNDSPCPVSFRLTVQQKLTGNLDSDPERRGGVSETSGGSVRSAFPHQSYDICSSQLYSCTVREEASIHAVKQHSGPL